MSHAPARPSAPLRALLVCPQCRGELEDREVDREPVLACPACAAAWPIVAGVPWLIPEHRRPAG